MKINQLEERKEMSHARNFSQFDALRLNSELVVDQPYDDIIFLLYLFNHLDKQCEDATDKLERLTKNMSKGPTDCRAFLTSDSTNDVDCRVFDLSFGTLERSEIFDHYNLLHGPFENFRALVEEEDLKFLQLEKIEMKIQNLLAQMAELEVEIATATPKTPQGILLKLQFLSGLYIDGSSFASDLLGFVVDQSVEQISKMLDIPLENPTT